MCIITWTESCCTITVKFNKSCAFQSFCLYIRLRLLFFWGFLQKKYRKTVSCAVLSMLGCRPGLKRSVSSLSLLYIIITDGNSLVWKMGFRLKSCWTRLYRTKKKKQANKKNNSLQTKRKKIQYIFVRLLSTRYENSFRGELEATQNRSGKY